ncbi:MAG: Crp/Fnr family transcriptional regulator, partial [Hyphomicrobiaceae bacterium]
MNVHQLSSTHRDDPFMVRLQRFMDIGSAAFTDLRKALGAEIAIKKKRDLVTDGYACSKLSFIRDGFAVRYKLLNSGKRQIVSILLPGDVIGLPGSFLDRATFSVIALTNMRLHACSLDSYVALCYRRPEFGLVLSWLAVQEATTYAERIIDIGRRTSQERLARFLLEIHSRLAAIGRATKAAFELPYSQEVISDALGLSVP